MWRCKGFGVGNPDSKAKFRGVISNCDEKLHDFEIICPTMRCIHTPSPLLHMDLPCNMKFTILGYTSCKFGNMVCPLTWNIEIHQSYVSTLYSGGECFISQGRDKSQWHRFSILLDSIGNLIILHIHCDK